MSVPKKSSGSIPLSQLAADDGEEVPSGFRVGSDRSSSSSPMKSTNGFRQRGMKMRVHLVDHTHRIVFVNPRKDTFADVWRLLCEDMKLPKEEWSHFFIWTISEDAETLMFADTTIKEVVDRNPSLRQEFRVGAAPPVKQESFLSRTFHRHRKSDLSQSVTKFDLTDDVISASQAVPTASPDDADCEVVDKDVMPQPGDDELKPVRFFFKTTQLLFLDEEQSIESEVGIKLLYIQAVHNVVKSIFPVTPSMAVKLAALQLQATEGDYNIAAQPPGFLKNKLKDIVPEFLKDQVPPKDWEKHIVPVYKRQSGKSDVAAMNQYLTIVRSLPSYGGSFFPVVFVPPRRSEIKLKFQGKKLSLCINSSGVHIIDVAATVKKKKKDTYSFPFKQVLSWGDERDSLFTLEVRPFENKGKIQLIEFETPYAHGIRVLMDDWLNEFKYREKMKDFAITQSQARRFPGRKEPQKVSDITDSQKKRVKFVETTDEIPDKPASPDPPSPVVEPSPPPPVVEPSPPSPVVEPSPPSPPPPQPSAPLVVLPPAQPSAPLPPAQNAPPPPGHAWMPPAPKNHAPPPPGVLEVNSDEDVDESSFRASDFDDGNSDDVPTYSPSDSDSDSNSGSDSGEEDVFYL